MQECFQLPIPAHPIRPCRGVHDRLFDIIPHLLLSLALLQPHRCVPLISCGSLSTLLTVSKFNSPEL